MTKTDIELKKLKHRLNSAQARTHRIYAIIRNAGMNKSLTSDEWNSMRAELYDDIEHLSFQSRKMDFLRKYFRISAISPSSKLRIAKADTMLTIKNQVKSEQKIKKIMKKFKLI